MKCPFCSNAESKVIDSRTAVEGDVIRRRRECEGCARRFTTYERVEEILPMVVKKDARREPFDRRKIVAGLRRACEKRPVTTEQIDSLVSEVEAELANLSEREVQATQVGEKVMDKLRQLDDVAYVRFASVYRAFRGIDELRAEIERVIGERAKEPPRSDKIGSRGSS